MRAIRSIFIVLVLMVGVGALGVAPSAAQTGDEQPEPFMGLVPRPQECVGEDDNPEMDFPLQLQGQVPWAHRLSGLAAEGYRCNLELVANIDGAVDDLSFGNAAFANFDVYEDCAYYSIGNTAATGMAVVDVSDSENPVRTTVLHTPGVGAPWESLRVNLARGLLAGSPSGSAALDLYSVAEDCRDPKLLSTTQMPSGRGHEGWFQPDGNVYYVAPIGAATAVDVSDPTAPKELGRWGQTHGGSTSLDGTRAYFCQTSPNAVTTWDTSAIARGATVEGTPEKVSEFRVPNGSACQQTYPLYYGGKPFVLQFGEAGPGGGCGPDRTLTNFAPPHLIDMSDERNPVLAARLMNEVNDPANCALVAGDRSAPVGTANDNFIAYALFVYGTHECTPDRIYDPTILACAEFLSGIRVYDIRDPYQPKELAYFNWGTLAPGVPTVEMHAARPVVRPDKGEIWFAGAYTGFSVLRFAEGVYPFPETLECPEQYDYLLDQYSTLCPASDYGVETAASGTPSGSAGAGAADDAPAVAGMTASPALPATGGPFLVLAALPLLAFGMRVSRRRSG